MAKKTDRLPNLIPISAQRWFLALLLLAGFLLGLISCAMIANDRAVSAEDRALAGSAILFLPVDSGDNDTQSADISALTEALQTSDGVLKATEVPRARQVRAIAGLIGNQLGAPSDLDELPLADVIQLELGSSADRDALLAQARAINPQATLIDFSDTREALAQSALPTRVLLALAALSVSLLALIATILSVRVIVLGQAQVWRTLMLVGAAPSFVLTRFARGFLSVAFPSLLVGALLGGAVIWSAQRWTPSRMPFDATFDQAAWTLWLSAALGACLLLAVLIALVARSTVFSRLR